MGTFTSDAPRDISPKRNSVPVSWIAATVIFLYAILIFCSIGDYACGGDSWGYLNCARLLDQGTPRVGQRLLAGAEFSKFQPYTFVPRGFRPIGDKQMVSEYSTGVPLAIAAFSRIAGWHLGPRLVLVVSSLAGILLTFQLGREWGLRGFWAGIGALILAANPLYLYHSIMMLSDVPALVCATAAVLMGGWSRSRNIWALAAGCIVAAGVLVRATNILIIAPVAVCLGFSWRRWLLLALGGLPGAVFLYLFTSRAYEHPFASSYGPDVPLAQFGAKNIPVILSHYIQWMPVLMTPLALFFLGLPCLVRRSPRRALTLLVWVSVFFGFYATFAGARGDWILNRYVLPAFPACLVGALWVLQTLLQSFWVAKLPSRLDWILEIRPRRVAWAAVWMVAVAWLIYDLHDNRHLANPYMHFLGPVLPVFLLLACGKVRDWLRNDFAKNLPILGKSLLVLAICHFFVVWNLYFQTFDIDGGSYERTDTESCLWAVKNLPPNAVIYADRLSGALYYLTAFTTLRWNDYFNGESRREIERACAADSQRPIYALLEIGEVASMKQTPFYESWAKNWTQFDTVKLYTCWRLNPPQSYSSLPAKPGLLVRADHLAPSPPEERAGQ